MIDHAEKPKEYLPRDIKDSHCNQYEDNTGEDLVEERKLLKPVLLRRNTKNVKEAVLSVAGGELPTSTSTEVPSWSPDGVTSTVYFEDYFCPLC